MDCNEICFLKELKDYDEKLFQHCVCVAAYAKELYHGDYTESVVKGALLHDVGKMMIPKEILKKKGRLSDEEYAIVKNHPLFGEQMLKKAGEKDEIILAIARDHHKRLDNSGYPNGLMAYQNEVMTVAICDMFDALTSQRPYKQAYNEDDAKKLLMYYAFVKKLDMSIAVELQNTVHAFTMDEKEMLKAKVRRNL